MNHLSQKDNLTLLVMKDEYPANPRKHFSNLSTLFLWEETNIDADVNRYKNANEMLRTMVYQTTSVTKMIDDVLNDKFPYLKISQDEGYNLQSFDAICKRWDTVLQFNQDTLEKLFVHVVYELNEEDLLHYAQDVAIIQPLYLTDSSDSTLYTTPIMGYYDGSECGYAMVLHKDIQQQYGEVSAETIEKANTVLEQEVDFFDKYLSQDSYEYKLYDGSEEIYSNYYIYGDMDEICEFISGDVDENFHEQVEFLLNNLKEVSSEEVSELFSEEEREEER